MIKSFAIKFECAIPKNLKKYIVAVIYGESESVIDITFPAMPTGYPLIINIYNDIPCLKINNVDIYPQSRLHIVGQLYDVDAHLIIKGQFGQIGIILHPAAPYYLFHKPGDYFLNQWREFTDGSPVNSDKMYAQLLKSQDNMGRVSVLFDFFEELSSQSLPAIDWLDESLQQIFINKGYISQTKLVEHSAISERHFRRKFKEIIGVSPKYFCKVVQLNAVFELLQSTNDSEISKLALDCGYFDQAHFINDFKKLIGNSPRSFFKSKHAYVKSYLGSRPES